MNLSLDIMLNNLGPFSRIIVVGSSLGLVTCIFMCFWPPNVPGLSSFLQSGTNLIRMWLVTPEMLVSLMHQSACLDRSVIT